MSAGRCPHLQRMARSARSGLAARYSVRHQARVLRTYPSTRYLTSRRGSLPPAAAHCIPTERGSWAATCTETSDPFSPGRSSFPASCVLHPTSRPRHPFPSPAFRSASPSSPGFRRRPCRSFRFIPKAKDTGLQHRSSSTQPTRTSRFSRLSPNARTPLLASAPSADRPHAGSTTPSHPYTLLSPRQITSPS